MIKVYVYIYPHIFINASDLDIKSLINISTYTNKLQLQSCFAFYYESDNNLFTLLNHQL